MLSNVELRRALSLAVDRQAIADSLYGGASRPATSIVPTGIPGYVERAWAYSRHDPAEARAALAEAGYPEGRGLPPLYVHLPAGASDASLMINLIADDFAAIGVTLIIQEVDYPQYLRRLENGDFMIGFGGWIADYPIVDNFLYPLFASDSSDNDCFYSDPAFSQAIADARATIDDAERAAKYQAIVATVGDAAPVIPLVQYSHRNVGSERLRDFVLDQMGLARLESAWLEGSGPLPIEGEGSA
jgi:peptide/nickel transport system substrate-binding protein/oligopeptide transport system substrate-binding protein